MYNIKRIPYSCFDNYCTHCINICGVFAITEGSQPPCHLLQYPYHLFSFEHKAVPPNQLHLVWWTVQPFLNNVSWGSSNHHVVTQSIWVNRGVMSNLCLDLCQNKLRHSFQNVTSSLRCHELCWHIVNSFSNQIRFYIYCINLATSGSHISKLGCTWSPQVKNKIYNTDSRWQTDSQPTFAWIWWLPR